MTRHSLGFLHGVVSFTSASDKPNLCVPMCSCVPVVFGLQTSTGVKYESKVIFSRWLPILSTSYYNFFANLRRQTDIYVNIYILKVNGIRKLT